jgi:hypothetical protein
VFVAGRLELSLTELLGDNCLVLAEGRNKPAFVGFTLVHAPDQHRRPTYTAQRSTNSALVGHLFLHRL